MVSSPSPGSGASMPVFSRTKLPVPYVFFASPGRARLSEQGGLLVAGDPGHGHLAAELLVVP